MIVMRIIEYVWLDGQYPVPMLRSKIRVAESSGVDVWSFDGSSTYQANPEESDLVLNPVRIYWNPFFKNGLLALCEVLNPDRTPHYSNTRRRLAEICDKVREEEPSIGMEQEYVFLRNGWPLGWPQNGYPEPQGKYYCGVGASRIFGRNIAEEHLGACLKAGVSIAGMNAEVMPSQWEYQIGPTDPLRAADDLWISRYILQRIAEKYGVDISFEPKPIEGKWSGSGVHINISIKSTRNSYYGKEIKGIIKKMEKYHTYLLTHYGEGNENRLTGDLETCDYNTFKYGEMDRTASVRIPWNTSYGRAGYIEDRRPAANMNPYDALAALLEVIFELS